VSDRNAQWPASGVRRREPQNGGSSGKSLRLASKTAKPQSLVPALLALPGKITKTGWQLPDNLSLDDWLKCGQALQAVDQSVQFWIGDWWAYGNHAYDERAKAAAEGLGKRAFSTLKDYGSVARNVERSLRNELLHFNHHRAVAPLEPSEQRRWLDRAVRDNLSVADLRLAIARERAINRTAKVNFNAEALGVAQAWPPSARRLRT
jgi:hypothetical protein